jgi:MerR family transcriptional regulator, mercuric resistance operon regulatory protein
MRDISNCNSCSCMDCSGSGPLRSRNSARSWPACDQTFSISFFALLEASESPYSFRTVVQSQAIHSLTIGKLAAAGRVGVETVRFYQRRGLLETPTRDGGIRRYGSDDVRRLTFIRLAQAAGFTLAEIKELLDLDAGEDRGRARELANARVKALDAKIAELERARDALRRLARECRSNGSGPCPILASFER